jgi:hypothetical protein
LITILDPHVPHRSTARRASSRSDLACRPRDTARRCTRSNRDAVLEIRASSDGAVALARGLDVSDALVGRVRPGELCKTPGSRRSAVASDRPGWALAFYTGIRRGEIGRSQWQHVFWDADEIMVAASKSDAGEGRRVPMVGPLKKILARGVDPSRPACDRTDSRAIGRFGEVAGSRRQGMDGVAARARDPA